MPARKVVYVVDDGPTYPRLADAIHAAKTKLAERGVFIGHVEEATSDPFAPFFQADTWIVWSATSMSRVCEVNA